MRKRPPYSAQFAQYRQAWQASGLGGQCGFEVFIGSTAWEKAKQQIRINDGNPYLPPVLFSLVPPGEDLRQYDWSGFAAPAESHCQEDYPVMIRQCGEASAADIRKLAVELLRHGAKKVYALWGEPPEFTIFRSLKPSEHPCTRPHCKYPTARCPYRIKNPV